MILAVWLLGARFLSLDFVIGRYEHAVAFVRDFWLMGLLLYTMLYIVVSGFGLPLATILTVVGGAIFGWKSGGIATIAGATIGACFLFLATRGVFRTHFTAVARPWLKSVEARFKADAASYLLFARLTPVLPFMGVTLAAALLGARFRTFAWTTLVGIIPGTFAYALIGSGLNQALRDEASRLRSCQATAGDLCKTTFDLTSLGSPKLALGLAALGCVLLISAMLRRFVER